MSYNILARRPLAGLVNELIDLDDRFEPFLGLRKNTVPVEIVSNEQSIVIRAEIPGVTKDDITIDYANRVVTISADKKHYSEKVEGQYFYSELRNGRLSRSVQLQTDVDFSKADAVFQDGTLTITIPRNSAVSETKIQIR